MADEMLVPVAGSAVRYLSTRTEVPVNGLVTAVQVGHGLTSTPKACIAMVDVKVDSDHMSVYGYPVVRHGDVIGELELALPGDPPANWNRWTLPGEI